MNPYKNLENSCEEIDASVFSGDLLWDPERLELLSVYVSRWVTAIEKHKAYAAEEAAEDLELENDDSEEPQDTAEVKNTRADELPLDTLSAQVVVDTLRAISKVAEETPVLTYQRMEELAKQGLAKYTVLRKNEISDAKEKAPAGFVLVPVKAPESLLNSMAMRNNHGFWLLDKNIQNSMKINMRQLHEEVVGKGFYSYENPSPMHTANTLEEVLASPRFQDKED